jgi:hypothetical protein
MYRATAKRRLRSAPIFFVCHIKAGDMQCAINQKEVDMIVKSALITVMSLVIVCILSPLDAQEKIISRKDAEFVFSLTKSQWEVASQKFLAPGWTKQSVKRESGSQIIGFDPSTRIGLSVQPFFENDRDPPQMVVVGNYFPLGVLPPMTDEIKKDMEAATKKDLGPPYTVRLVYSKMEKMETIEIILSKKK